MSEEGPVFDLKSEFAHVQVSLDTSGNGPRLAIKSVKNGASIYLDPLELEALTGLLHKDLEVFLDPSFRQWTNRPQD